MTSQALGGEIQRILRAVNAEGAFAATVLTDAQGLVLAAEAGPGSEPSAQAAVVALVEKTAGRGLRQMGMAATDEITIFDAQGRRLVCRPFLVDDKVFLLSVLVADRRAAYRRSTNRGIVELQRALATR